MGLGLVMPDKCRAAGARCALLTDLPSRMPPSPSPATSETWLPATTGEPAGGASLHLLGSQKPPCGIGDFSGPSGDDTNTAWMVRGGVLAPFGTTVTGWANGSFTHAEDDVNDDSYDFWAFAVGAAWAPNSAIAMGPEVAYNNIDGDDPGEDGDVWGAMWRVEATY